MYNGITSAVGLAGPSPVRTMPTTLLHYPPPQLSSHCFCPNYAPAPLPAKLSLRPSQVSPPPTHLALTVPGYAKLCPFPTHLAVTVPDYAKLCPDPTPLALTVPDYAKL